MVIGSTLTRRLIPAVLGAAAISIAAVLTASAAPAWSSTISLSTDHGVPGDQVTIDGNGPDTPDGGNCVVTIDGSAVRNAVCTIDGSGSIIGSFVVPSLRPGSVLVAVCAPGCFDDRPTPQDLAYWQATQSFFVPDPIPTTVPGTVPVTLPETQQRTGQATPPSTAPETQSNTAAESTTTATVLPAAGAPASTLPVWLRPAGFALLGVLVVGLGGFGLRRVTKRTRDPHPAPGQLSVLAAVGTVFIEVHPTDPSQHDHVFESVGQRRASSTTLQETIK